MAEVLIASEGYVVVGYRIIGSDGAGMGFKLEAQLPAISQAKFDRIIPTAIPAINTLDFDRSPGWSIELWIAASACERGLDDFSKGLELTAAPLVAGHF